MENYKKYLLLQEIFTYYCAVILIYYDGIIHGSKSTCTVY